MKKNIFCSFFSSPRRPEDKNVCRGFIPAPTSSSFVLLFQGSKTWPVAFAYVEIHVFIFCFTLISYKRTTCNSPPGHTQSWVTSTPSGLTRPSSYQVRSSFSFNIVPVFDFFQEFFCLILFRLRILRNQVAAADLLRSVQSSVGGLGLGGSSLTFKSSLSRWEKKRTEKNRNHVSFRFVPVTWRFDEFGFFSLRSENLSFHIRPFWILFLLSVHFTIGWS